MNRQQTLKYLLALLQVSGISLRIKYQLWQTFPDLAELFQSPTQLLLAKGLRSELIIALREIDWQKIATEMQWVDGKTRHMITLSDPIYPNLLKEITDPPLLLYVNGDPAVLNMPQLAIVGSRNPTPLGSEIAANFACELAKMGLVITSGLASGIDTAAHQGALLAQRKTVAVLGTGLQQIYPRTNKNLAQSIVEQGGTLISEFSLQSQAHAWHFPQRNRIISGLSLGTVVVEATMRSGSLITARLASEQGREVFALPGSIHNPLARGCHYLLRQGAKLVEELSDIIEELNLKINLSNTKSVDITNVICKNELDSKQKKLLDFIGYEVTTIDLLVQRANLPMAEVHRILLDLELSGLIRSVFGGYIKASS